LTSIRTISIGAWARLAALALLTWTASAGGADDDLAPANAYMTGADVRIDRAIDGDLAAAAGRIHIDQPIAGDAVLGAGSIDVQSTIGEDLRGAAGIVTVAGRVGNDVLLAAGRIIFTPAADVQGETWLAAASVSLAGRFASAVRIYAREITVTGETYGALELSAQRIEIGDGARVHGDLVYSSDEEIRIHPLARVGGKVTRKPKRLEANEPARALPGLKPLRPLTIAALLAFGMLLLAVFPRLTASSVRTLAAAPAKSLGLGTALFFGVPPVAVLLIITIIGIPIALVAILAHALALGCGYIVTAALLGRGIARAARRPAPAAGWQQYAFLAIALLVLALVSSIPYLGVLVLLLACSAGLGAIVQQRFSQRSVAAGRADEWPAA
jgi:cytoskeletal protein CcmA (bactofilin family)